MEDERFRNMLQSLSERLARAGSEKVAITLDEMNQTIADAGYWDGPLPTDLKSPQAHELQKRRNRLYRGLDTHSRREDCDHLPFYVEPYVKGGMHFVMIMSTNAGAEDLPGDQNKEAEHMFVRFLAQIATFRKCSSLTPINKIRMSVAEQVMKLCAAQFRSVNQTFAQAAVEGTAAMAALHQRFAREAAEQASVNEMAALMNASSLLSKAKPNDGEDDMPYGMQSAE